MRNKEKRKRHGEGKKRNNKQRAGKEKPKRWGRGKKHRKRPLSTQTLPTESISGRINFGKEYSMIIPTKLFPPELFSPRLPKSLACKSVKFVSQSVIITEKILR